MYFCPSIDALEDRRLLSASPANTIAVPLEAVSVVVSRSVFYNNSRFDGNDPAANASDDGAIAIDKTALLPGQTATFTNYTSYRGGINGVIVDIAGIVGSPTASDFLFHVGNNNDPKTWAFAPAPASITARPGAGVAGSTRVTIVWPDGAIVNQWLQVGVRATPNTGLSKPDVFYFGNAIGESGNSPESTMVNVLDQSAARLNPRGLNDPVSLASPYDYNRDGVVSAADEMIARTFATSSTGSLRLITPSVEPAWSDVIFRRVFYNNSQFDGNDAAANANDDDAIAADKLALTPGGTGSFANYTNYSRGIDGIMVDIAGLTEALTAEDFDFRVGNTSDPAGWTPAPPPSDIAVRFGAGGGGSARVTITWPDNAIEKQWLQVTVKPTVRTKLLLSDVFAFGNAIGEIGDSTTNAVVNVYDLGRVREFIGGDAQSSSTPFDLNRDQVIDTADENIVSANFALGAKALKLIRLPPTASSQTTPANVETVYADFTVADVVGRQVFYNNSYFDGENPAATPADDGAIATDKSALFPGSTSSFANYTSYSGGLNGIMVDIAGLPAEPTAADFEFRVGNTPNTEQWPAAPSPHSITVRPGAGVGGSARVTITWDDNAIQRQWLQVTVKATPNTGLAKNDVFYFGNAIGESGNSTVNASVNAYDQGVARIPVELLFNSATITATNDYNRDGVVDGADEWIAVRATSSSASLRLLAAPAAAVTTAPQREPIEFFNRGDAGINVFFAPNLVKTNDGTLLAIAEGRWAEDDKQSYALVMRRSTDGGASWSPISTIYRIAAFTPDYIGNPSAVVDAITGEIFLLFVKNTSDVFVTKSSDDGLTWSSPVEITGSVKVTVDGNPNPAAFSSAPWGWYATGPGHGIQIQQGPYAGRLLIACDHRSTDDRSGPSWSHVIYSDDHGQTWHLGGGLDQENTLNDYSNEISVVEQSDGALYMSIRINEGSSIRGFSRSDDGGATWTVMARDPRLTTFGVEASLLRVNENTVLLSAPDSSDGTRRQMTIWISHDDMQTWSKTKTVFFGYSGYSDMVLVGPDTVLLAYNRGHANGNSWQSIGLARFNLRWLEDPDPYQFQWNFNEQAPLERANIEGTSIQDYGPWDSRAQAQAASLAEAPIYVSGVGGNTALALTRGSDSVLLTPSATQALQFGATDDFTIELTMRTSDSTGVILGTRASVRGWSLQLTSGLLQFGLDDGQRKVSITSSAAVNDGLWHHVAAVRDTMTHRLRLYVDGAPAASVVDTTTLTLRSNEPVTLGAYNDGSSQLALDVDTLRVTRSALRPDQFLAVGFVEPPRFPPPVARAGAPSSLANLQFWLPAYDYSRNFGDLRYADPVPIAPVDGSAVRSAIEASPNQYKVSVDNEIREVLYANDPSVGPNWLHTATSQGAGQQWVVLNSNGTQATNFDFVQNTGVFTLSTFIKVGANLEASMALFDTAQSTSANSGFSLLVTSTGALTMLIVGPDSTIRLNQNTSNGLVTPGSWYHIAVVGNGPGNPIMFYVTPVSQSAVRSYQSSRVISGDNGNYATDANHDLTIGSLSNSGLASFNGQMVDQAIYHRALSPAEIQQLFNYTKRS